MEIEIIDMGEQAFILINAPLILLNLAANIFYACCLIFPPRNAPRLKQPLKMLLGCLFWSSIGYCVSLALLYCVLKEKKHLIMSILLWVIVLFFLHNSMSCSVWLNFYYYIQIVPAQRALMVWVKRNIKSVMNMALLFDGTLFFFSGAIYSAIMILNVKTFTYINGTETGHQFDGLHFTEEVCIYINKVNIFLSLCIMTVSSFSTARYLHRHMKSVAQGFSTPRIQSQMRVTITGISQGVFYFLYGTFYIYGSFTSILPSPHGFGPWISFTATSLYISGTTVNLGIGQAVCRQRAADGWKALKALCGAGMCEV
ncbi:uncharacterized protein LOC119500416 [Sebastes umbrosus]|uniref:uncharacterized protein LOC119500416 n=1 Tax=Sebastes umbrosus TaxID=72105 RepID=UPI00189EDA45|nr:uncharacterized protein LOC119500416 [Sebastes umbrosus]